MNTIIKMKKHPIDDLFAKKLAEHRQEPSQKAFEKFQARLAENQQKRRGGFFLANRNWGYYAAAAGIVAVLTIGILSQSTITNETVVASADVPKKVENKIKNISKEKDSQLVDNQLVAVKEDVKKSSKIYFSQPEKAILKKVKTLPIISNETSVAKLENKSTSGVPQVPQNTIIDDSPVEQTSVAINPIFETSIETIEPKETKIAETFKNPIDESIVLVLEPEQQEELIPAINPDSPTSLAEAKILGAEKEENAKSFIAKLYGEYKHFKYGEKVDLKKLGVKDVLARVDDSVLKEDITDVRDFVQRKVGRLQKRD
jgi:hypothetical protein